MKLLRLNVTCHKITVCFLLMMLRSTSEFIVVIVWFLALPISSMTETIGHVTRDYFGDIFTLEYCAPGSCDKEGRRAAHIPGEKCRCQCAPSHYTFREDLRECIKDVGECPVAMFVRPFAVEKIPLVFLPIKGQLVYPGAHLTVSGITRLAPTKNLACNVKASLLMTSQGWQPIRTTTNIFEVYYNGNKTYLQWLGDDEDRRRLQHHLVLIRLMCEGESSNGTFEPCAALRIGWAPGLEPELGDQTSNKNNFIIIGLCLSILGLIYVGAVLIYLKVRKNRRQASRQGHAISRSSIEVTDEEENCAQLRNTYINNLVQEAELTTKSSLKGSHNQSSNDHDTSSLEINHYNHTDSSTCEVNYSKNNGKNTNSKGAEAAEDYPPAQSPPQEFFVRIRGMIAAAKNRLNSFRYRPTLLVIPEDDYFYQDFKERDIEVSGNRKSSFKKLSRKGNTPAMTKKMESIHGSNLGAAMLESKLAPPLPPPRNGKSKKRAPSPPGERISYPEFTRESPSPVSLNDLHDSIGRKRRKSSSVSAENYSKFDLFRLDLYEKISRLREGVGSENEIAVLEMADRKRTDDSSSTSYSTENNFTKEGILDNCCTSKDYVSDREIADNKISRRQLLHKLHEAEISIEENKSHYAQLNKVKSKRNKVSNEKSEKTNEEKMKDEIKTHHIDDINESAIMHVSRPSTSMSNCSGNTSSSQPSTMKEKHTVPIDCNGDTERDDGTDCSETSDASLSGDSLNSSFRKPTKPRSSMKSKNSKKSLENLSVISGSSVVTSSTALKESNDYGDDDDHRVEDEEIYDTETQEDDSRLSTDLDAEIYSIEDSEHPSLEEYLQLSTQVAKKLSERAVPTFSNDLPKEKNMISQFVKEFKNSIGRLKSVEDVKPRTSPTLGADNWTLKKEEKKSKYSRNIFKRNLLKGRKSEEPLVSDESGKNGYYDINVASETDDATSSKSSSASSISGKKGKRYKRKTEIVPATKVIDVGEKTVISVENKSSENGMISNRENTKPISSKRLGKPITPPLPPTAKKPDINKLQMKNHIKQKENQNIAKKLRNSAIEEDECNTSADEQERFVETSSIESDSISVNSDMTQDSLNTPVPPNESEDENREDVSEEENGPIDKCLAQLADSVIQPPDDCSLNRYLSHLGNVLATRDDGEFDQCLNKLANNLTKNRATKGFNLSHLPICTWEHVCVDKTSDRSTPTSDRSSNTSRGSRSSQENLRKKTLAKSKHHHHHHHHLNECKHSNGDATQISSTLEKTNHVTNGKPYTNGKDAFATHILVERAAALQNVLRKHRIASTSEEEECGRASSLGSTRELETPIPETTSDPGSADLERPRKKKPLLRRSKKGLNGTCRQHIQNNKFSKKDVGSLRKSTQVRNTGTPRSSGSDVTVIQLEGDANQHVTNVDCSNTFVTLINIDSSDCSNSAEEK